MTTPGFGTVTADAASDTGKLRLFVAIDRTSKLPYAELHQEAGKMVAAPIQAVGRPRALLLAPHRTWLLERLGSGEHVTLRGLQAELAGRGTKVDHRTVWNFVQAEGLSFKKNRSAKRAVPS